MQFTGLDAEMARLKKEIRKFEDEAVVEVKETVRYLLERMMERTPVWHGTTVRNYNVSLRGFSRAFSTAAGSGPPGPTNSMEMGTEPRRGANEAAARAAMETALTFQRLSDVYINNTSPHADLVDMGDAPGGKNQKIRNPGGVTVLAVQSTRNARRHWK